MLPSRGWRAADAEGAIRIDASPPFKGAPTTSTRPSVNVTGCLFIVDARTGRRRPIRQLDEM
jgi:hypothetical protein